MDPFHWDLEGVFPTLFLLSAFSPGVPQKMFCLILLPDPGKWSEMRTLKPGDWNSLSEAVMLVAFVENFQCTGEESDKNGVMASMVGGQKQPGTSALSSYLLLCLHAEAEGRGGLSHQTISYAKSSLQLPQS